MNTLIILFLPKGFKKLNRYLQILLLHSEMIGTL